MNRRRPSTTSRPRNKRSAEFGDRRPKRPSNRPPRSEGRRRGKEEEVPRGQAIDAAGILELMPEGYGFLRRAENNFQTDSLDPHVPASMVRRFHLRPGCMVTGKAAGRNGKYQLQQIETIEGLDPQVHSERPLFQRLTSIDPIERLRIDEGNDLAMRLLDLIAPIGKGQRGLIVASPRTGKTMLLQKLAEAITSAHPEVHLIVALVDERPEEVTEMKRMVRGEVVHSSNDHPPKRHVKVVEMVLERARRMVEGGQDVVILLDSLTRVARAYNNLNRGSGRTLSGGLDSQTMIKPREFFGAARKAEEGGSLTIIATALVDTGSRMDDVIFEEFKGTGNMELYLHRSLADRRVWPAIDIQKSGTRKEEKLREKDDHTRVNMLRRALADHSPEHALPLLLAKLEKTGSNREFLNQITVAG